MGVNRFIFVGRKNNYHTVMRAEGERTQPAHDRPSTLKYGWNKVSCGFNVETTLIQRLKLNGWKTFGTWSTFNVEIWLKKWQLWFQRWNNVDTTFKAERLKNFRHTTNLQRWNMVEIRSVVLTFKQRWKCLMLNGWKRLINF